MASAGNSYAWVQLNWNQLDAILALARAADSQPGALTRLLAEPQQRACLRTAVAALTRLREAGGEVQ